MKDQIQYLKKLIIVKTAEVLTEKVLPEIPDGDSITELDDLEISVRKINQDISNPKLL